MTCVWICEQIVTITYCLDFCQSFRHPWWGMVFRDDCRVHRFMLFQNYMLSRWFCTPPLHLRQCLALLAVAERWLLFDIGMICFVPTCNMASVKASRSGIRQGTLEIVIQEVLWSIWGCYQTIWSFPLTNVKWHSVTWPYTMTTPYWSDFVPNSTLYRILSCFHRSFATGVACRQGTLTPPDTWSRTLGTFRCFYLLRPILFRTCRYFSGLCSSNIPRYHLDFA